MIITGTDSGIADNPYTRYILQYAVIPVWQLEELVQDVAALPEDSLESAVKQAEKLIADGSREDQCIVKVLKTVSLASRETVTVDFINNEEESTDES